jgi:hypothetical protein
MKRAFRTAAAGIFVVELLGCDMESERTLAGIVTASRTSSFSAWSDPVSLGSTINSSFNEAQSTLSKDGLTLYFASNRPEGA